MKNSIFILFAFISCMSMHAQSWDTVYYPNGRCPYYYYQEWYDTAESYFGCIDTLPTVRYSFGVENFMWDTRSGRYSPRVNETKVSEPMLFKGVAVLTADTNMDYFIFREWTQGDLAMAPDTVYAFSFDTANQTKLILATARWDTATPKIWRLPLTCDTTCPDSVNFIKVFEVMFDHPLPVEADSSIYFVGTSNSLQYLWNRFLYNPHYYVSFCRFIPQPRTEILCTFQTHHDSIDEDHLPFYAHYYSYHNDHYRPAPYGFLPIIDTSAADSLLLRASSANPDMGSAGPAEQRVRRWFWGTVSATPLPGFQFDHWNDGSRENPLRVQMVTDSVHYIASFRQGIFTVDADSYNKDEGFVTGGGLYHGFDTAVIEAFPAQGYIFSRWNDGDTSNPRRVEVVSDTAFIAYFETDTTPDTAAITPVGDAVPGLFTLTPNPTTGSVTLQMKSEKLKDKSCTVTVLDAAGHEVLRTTLNSQPSTLNLNLSSLPAGTYFVTLSDGANTATQKLMIR